MVFSDYLELSDGVSPYREVGGCPEYLLSAVLEAKGLCFRLGGIRVDDDGERSVSALVCRGCEGLAPVWIKPAKGYRWGGDCYGYISDAVLRFPDGEDAPVYVSVLVTDKGEKEELSLLHSTK